jgi:oleandomycin transport system ATP-binding protein
VCPTDGARLAETAAILAEVSTAGAPEQSRKGVLSVPVADDDALTATVARLASAGISVTELSLHLPSLDEVFFTLTGRTSFVIESTNEEVA